MIDGYIVLKIPFTITDRKELDSDDLNVEKLESMQIVSPYLINADLSAEELIAKLHDDGLIDIEMNNHPKEYQC